MIKYFLIIIPIKKFGLDIVSKIVNVDVMNQKMSITVRLQKTVDFKSAIEKIESCQIEPVFQKSAILRNSF